MQKFRKCRGRKRSCWLILLPLKPRLRQCEPTSTFSTSRKKISLALKKSTGRSSMRSNYSCGPIRKSEGACVICSSMCPLSWRRCGAVMSSLTRSISYLSAILTLSTDFVWVAWRGRSKCAGLRSMLALGRLRSLFIR
eukprot:Rmarinus@m.29266